MLAISKHIRCMQASGQEGLMALCHVVFTNGFGKASGLCLPIMFLHPSWHGGWYWAEIHLDVLSSVIREWQTNKILINPNSLAFHLQQGHQGKPTIFGHDFGFGKFKKVRSESIVNVVDELMMSTWNEWTEVHIMNDMLTDVQVFLPMKTMWVRRWNRKGILVYKGKILSNNYLQQRLCSIQTLTPLLQNSTRAQSVFLQVTSEVVPLTVNLTRKLS